MLAVLQILLKILGLILLSLIGILVILLIIVLIVPVRYRAKGYYKEEFICHGKVTWLLHLVSITIDYENELQTTIRIFGIPLSAFQKRAKRKEEKVVDKTENETAEISSEVKVDEAADIEEQTLEETDADSKQINDKADSLIQDEISQKTSVFQKIKQKIQGIFLRIRQLWNKLCNTILSIKEKKDSLQHYVAILKRDEVKKAFSLCKKRLWILLKHILPKKMKVTVDFGFDDPASTGYVMAIYGMLPVSVGKKVILHPDFEHSLFVCDFKIKGAVRAWNLLHQLLCIISDKNCRALYHIVKKEILNERK